MLNEILAQSIPLGGYIAIWKVIVFVVLFCFWAWIGQWIDKDAPAVGTRRDFWNNVYLFSAAGYFVLAFLLPVIYLVQLSIFLVIWITVTVVYIMHRNSLVEPNQTILTADHIRWLLSFYSRRDHNKSRRLVFISVNNNELPVPEKFDNEYNGYLMSEELLHDLWYRRISHAELVPVQESYQLRVVIDGMPSVDDTFEVEDAQEIIKYLKSVAGLDVEDKRRPQKGSFFTIRTGDDHTGWRIQTSGSTRGEQIVMDRIVESHIKAIDSLGLHPDQVDQIQEVIKKDEGVMVITGQKNSGVTTTLYSIIRRHDAFVQNIHTFESEPLTELDNITQHFLDQDAGAPTHTRQLQTVLHNDPTIIMVGFLDEPEMASLITKVAYRDKRKFFVGMEAPNVFEALKKWLTTVKDPKKVAGTLTGFTNQKLLRKICLECREGYSPDTNLLKKLNLPAGKIKQFYRPPSEEVFDKKGNPILCENCQGTGYYGQTAVYETLIISPEMRQLIADNADWESIMTQCRKEKVLYLQEQALRKVIEGTTSIQEVIRITSDKKKARQKTK